MSPRRPPSPDDLTPAAGCRVALRLLAGREFTTAELRARLLRRGFPPAVADDVLRALTEQGAVDDGRAARARARHEAVIKRHGRSRALRQVQALGVDRDTARQAVAAAFEDIDESDLLARALARRLRGAPLPSDPLARRRLEAWLVGQGFEPAAVRKLISQALTGASRC